MDYLKHDGEARTDMYCTNCRKYFVALLDYSINGNHEINCPYCDHIHCRVIYGGKITDERWDSRNPDTDVVTARKVWKSSNIEATTTSTSLFLRGLWLDRDI